MDTCGSGFIYPVTALLEVKFIMSLLYLPHSRFTSITLYVNFLKPKLSTNTPES
jgi:hypothetical protein